MSNDKDFKVKNGVKPTVYHEKLGTVVSGTGYYSLANASYDSVSFSVTAQDTDPHGIFFKPDGTAFYYLGRTNNTVFQYTLSTAWDLSTASYASKSFSVISQVSSLGMCVRFKPDGTKMYVVGLTNDRIFQYSLGTAWDVTTASYDSKFFSVSAQDANPSGFVFNNDGTKVVLTGYLTDLLYEYTLSTAWDISTASYGSVSYNPVITNPFDLTFNSDGTKLFIVNSNSIVYSYTLSTPYDISTANNDGVTFNASSQDSAMDGVAFDATGSKMYLLGYGNDVVYQYSTTLNTRTLDLSTGSVFQLTPSSNIQLNLSNPAASGTVSGATLLLSASGTAYTITYDSSVDFPGGTAPTSPAVGDTDVLVFTTRDGGTSYKAALAIDGAV